jgi:hypothetical protein
VYSLSPVYPGNAFKPPCWQSLKYEQKYLYADALNRKAVQRNLNTAVNTKIGLS